MKTKPGPKLNRTETVTIRLDIDTKAAAVEAAWESRRTLSSWIESVIIEKCGLNGPKGRKTHELVTRT